MRPEAKVQLKVCEFLQEEYPDVIFHSDLSSGAVLPIGAAMMNKRLQYSNGLPDVYIFEARNIWEESPFAEDVWGDHIVQKHGLVLELKADGVVIFKKDGSLRKDEHLEEQAIILQGFRDRGWVAEFAIGFEAAKIIINNYLHE